MIVAPVQIGLIGPKATNAEGQPSAGRRVGPLVDGSDLRPYAQKLRWRLIGGASHGGRACG